MSGHIEAALILALPLLMIGTALGGEGVQVKVTNDGTQDIVVTVAAKCADQRFHLGAHLRHSGCHRASKPGVDSDQRRCDIDEVRTC
jgi:hypothetical protein